MLLISSVHGTNVRATLKHSGDHTITQADRGETQSMDKSMRHTVRRISPDRGENQREKSKVPTASEPVLYYAWLQSGPSIGTHWPALHRSLTNPGCLYTNCFPSKAALEVVGDPLKISPYSSYLGPFSVYFLSLPPVSENPKPREKQNNYLKKTALKCKITSAINN